MEVTASFYSTSIGKKVVVAVTGLILFLYVFVHMLGNLQIYWGPELINQYAAFLHSARALPLLWTVRVVLIVSFVLHIVTTLQLWWENRKARPVKYAVRRYIEVDYASRTMIWSGPIIGLFVLYHLLHLTTHTVQPVPVVKDNLYATMVAGFRVWYVSAVYIVAVVALAFHFYHGLWSWFQTLGLAHPKYNRLRRWLATCLAFAVAIGDVSIPVAALTGLIG